MLAANVPPKFNIPWANGAGPSFIRPIPEASQIGITDGAASLTDGWPPLNFLAPGGGGVPPFGQDANGILKQITQWAQWLSAGAPVHWDGTFSTAIGGYPQGAIVMSNVTLGQLWMSLVDNNTTDPDTGGANWQAVGFIGSTAGGDLTGTYPDPTIAAGAVTNAKLANMAAKTIKANITAGAAPPTDVSYLDFLNALNLNFGAQLSNPGWLDLPNNTILQWAPFSLGTAGGASQVVSFPLAYHSFIVPQGIVAVTNAAVEMIGTLNPTLTSITVVKGANDDIFARSGTVYVLGG